MEISGNKRDNIALIFVLSQVFENSGGSPLSLLSLLLFTGPPLCHVGSQGKDKAFDRLMKFDDLHCSFLMSSLSGAKLFNYKGSDNPEQMCPLFFSCKSKLQQ